MTRVRMSSAVLLSVALVLGGCAHLPTSGEVRSGVELPVSRDGVIDLLADGPQGGETPEQIVDFFLRAQAAWQSDDFEAAEAFLTPEARENWSPHERVIVHRGDDSTAFIGTETDDDGNTTEVVLEVMDPDATRVTIEKTVVPLANVTVDGVRTEMDPRESLPLRFNVELDDTGEWRISELPGGIVISQANFDTVYQRVPLYFLSADRAHLIPEIRWVPVRDSASHVVQGLVGGPSSVWVRTLFTEFPVSRPSVGTTVTVERGVARVELPSAVTALDSESRAYLQAQFDYSLRSLTGINQVELSLNDQPLRIAESVDVVVRPTRTDPFFTLEEDGLYTMSGGSSTLVHDNIDPEWLEAADLVFDNDGRVLATVNGDRTEVWIQTNPGVADVVITGTDISNLSVDRFGWRWFAVTPDSDSVEPPEEAEDSDDEAAAPEATSPPVPFAPDHMVKAVHPDGTVLTVPQPWITTGEITSLSVSLDGSRIVGVTHSDEARSVEMSAIERDNLGRPRSIGMSTRQAKNLSTPVGAEWMNDDTLLVVSDSVLTGRQTVNTVPISDTATGLSPGGFDVIRSMSAGSAGQSTYVLAVDHELHQLLGTVWQPVRANVLWAGFAN